VSVPGSFQLLYLLLLFTSLFIARKNKQVYHGLINSYERLKEASSFSSEVLMEAIRQRGQLIREVNMHQLGGLEAEVRHTQTKEELWAINALLRQGIYNLQVYNSHLSQMLHQSQDYMRLSTADILLQDLLQGVFEDIHEQKRMQVCTHRYTTHQGFQVDVKKMRQLLVSGLHYAKECQPAERPILLGFEDTLLVYPILSIAGYVKRVPSVRITITNETSLPPHRAWYVGSVDSPALHLPKAYSELSITHNQQIVDAHYGTSEFVESEHGMTQVYVIPVRVREVRPQTMDLLPTAAVLSEAPIYPEEEALVKEVQERTQVDMAMLRQALQLIKQYHAGVKRNSEEPFYLHPVAVAHILLDYTRDQDTIIAALLHDTVADTKLSLNQIVLHFNPEVQRIVDGVTGLDSRSQSFKRIQLSAHESIQKLLEVRDKRILYVKLADRLHNMRTIEGHPSLDKQKKIAEETLQFFVPMARSLGLKPMAEELNKRCFEVLGRRQDNTGGISSEPRIWDNG
jgi:HD domain